MAKIEKFCGYDCVILGAGDYAVLGEHFSCSAETAEKEILDAIGGACATIAREAEIITALGLRTTDEIIVIQDILSKKLTHSELDAILYHEVGHLVNGHRVANTSPETALKNELEADAYAVAFVGKNALRSAIKKALHLASDSISDSDQVFLDIVMNGNEVVQRLKALED